MLNGVQFNRVNIEATKLHMFNDVCSYSVTIEIVSYFCLQRVVGFTQIVMLKGSWHLPSLVA